MRRLAMIAVGAALAAAVLFSSAWAQAQKYPSPFRPRVPAGAQETPSTTTRQADGGQTVVYGAQPRRSPDGGHYDIR